MRKTATTTSGAPREGAPPPTSGNDSPHPSPPRKSAPAAGPAATSATSPPASHGGGSTTSSDRPTGPAGSSRATAGCAARFTIILPDGRAVTREAIGGYPDMPAEEDRVKGGDSDAFKRACVLFGIGEYLYGDEPAEPAEPRRATPTPTSNGDGRGEPRNVPRDRISFPDARALLRLAQGQRPPRPRRGDRQPRGLAGHGSSTGRPRRSTPATLEILERTRPRPLTTPAARGRGSPGLGAGDAAPADGSDGDGRADEAGMADDRADEGRADS